MSDNKLEATRIINVLFLTKDVIPNQIAKMCLDADEFDDDVETVVSSVKDQFFSEYMVSPDLVNVFFYIEEFDDEDVTGEMIVNTNE